MSTRFHDFLWATFLLGTLACAGCTPSLPPMTDPKDARAALETALDTWKRGESPQTLKERTPPIQFADLNWDKGARLLKYEIATEEQRGLGMRITVKLSLEGKDGKRRDATTVYTAETQPKIIIVPEF
jgi:hypothetical protein